MKGLVLEGGGILGAAQPAILLSLKERGLFNQSEYKVFSGTSIGALNALMFAVELKVKDIVQLWSTVNGDDIIPKVWYMPWRRKNKLKEFVENIILPLVNMPKDITCSQLYEKTGNILYTISYVLQENKGIIFGKDCHDVKVSEAVMYSVSHPMKFNTNEYNFNGNTYDLSDGGIFMNCPVLPIAEISGLTDVYCITVINGNEKSKKKRYTGHLEVFERIVGGLVERNEFVSYDLGHDIWGDGFKIWTAQIDKEIDIFDDKEIKRVIEIGTEAGKNGSPTEIPAFLNAKMKIQSTSRFNQYLFL